MGWKATAWGLAIGRGAAATRKLREMAMAGSLLGGRRKALTKEVEEALDLPKERRVVPPEPHRALDLFGRRFGGWPMTSTYARLERMVAQIIGPQRATTDRGDNQHR
ncbi:hypothetical protein BHE74_00023461 [Ensete ventricosum]|nr:hypothetical protein BHE74_00023461 [Ensete ventricosum]